MHAFDTSALSAPVKPADVDRFRDRSLHAGSSAPFTPRAAIGQSLIVLVGGILALALGIAALALSPSAFVVVISAILLVLGVGGVVLGVVLLARSRRSVTDQWPALYRQSLVAAANGFEFVVSESAPGLPGIVFQLGSNPRSYSVFRSAGDGTAARAGEEFGNYRFDLRRDDPNAFPLTWSYVTTATPTTVGRVIVSTRGSRRAVYYDQSRLERSPSRDARFDIWRPAGTGLDVESLFTPALLDLLSARHLTIELNAGRVFVYSDQWRDFAATSAIDDVAALLDAVDAGVVTRQA